MAAQGNEYDQRMRWLAIRINQLLEKQRRLEQDVERMKTQQALMIPASYKNG